MKERFVEEIEDHGEWVLTRTIKEVWHKKKDLEEEAYGPEDYEQIKAKQEMEHEDKQTKQERVKREKGQLQRAQQKVNQQRSDLARATSN